MEVGKRERGEDKMTKRKKQTVILIKEEEKDKEKEEKREIWKTREG